MHKEHRIDAINKPAAAITSLINVIFKDSNLKMTSRIRITARDIKPIRINLLGIRKVFKSIKAIGQRRPSKTSLFAIKIVP